MSTPKRSRQRQTDAQAASPPPASKRLKTTKTSHVPAHGGLGFLVDEDARSGRKLEARLTNGVPSSKATRVDESRAVVAPDTKDINHQVGSSAENAFEISSAEESSNDSSDEDEVEIPLPRGKQLAAGRPLVNGHAVERDHDGESEPDAVAGAEDVDMAEPEIEQEDEEELGEPSFGDMLQARHPDPIDVAASFRDPMAAGQALIPTSGNRTLMAPSGTSLVTVLTQALKTNDKELLETCFQTTDQQTIRTTVQRLQSQHVATLLQRLAERIYKRPGRTGKLLTWIQWSLVAHGGYLATQPEVMNKLKALSQVIRERANGLQPLLHLKGKLDMLSAQLDLRRNMQAMSRAAHAEDDEDEEGVVYVEGQDEDWSDSDDAELGAQNESSLIPPPTSKTKLQIATPRTDVSASEDDSEGDDDFPNGVAQEANDDSSDEEDDEEEGMLDIEADETSKDDSAEEGSDSDEEEDSYPESSDDEVDVSDDESDASAVVKAPNPRMLDRKR